VSAWGGAGTPDLAAFIESPDLDARLALVDAETAAHGLHLTREIPIVLPHGGGLARIRGYEGTDSLGRPVHAIRVATTRSVVMAVGPLDARETARDAATELVPALMTDDGGRAAAFLSGTDLTGDGATSVVARSETGQLTIWRVTSLGASPYPAVMAAPAMQGLDVDGDGRVDLVGNLVADAPDAIAPKLSCAATFDGVRFSDRTEGARAFHAALAEVAKSDDKPSDEARIRRAIERAWHAVLAGKSKDEALKELGSEAVPPRLRAAFDHWVGVISSAPAGPAPRTPGGT
jgi:hypothetical protein